MKRGHKNAHTDLTADEVRQIVSYEPTAGILRWKIASGKAKIGAVAGFSQANGRIKIGIRGNEYMAHRIIWLIMTGEWPEYEIDHEDEDQSNNRWNNLRHATPSQNHRNRGAQKNNTTGFKGVAWDKKRQCFIAGVKHRGVRHNCRGRFETAEEAYEAAKALAAKLHGEWSRYD